MHCILFKLKNPSHVLWCSVNKHEFLGAVALVSLHSFVMGQHVANIPSHDRHVHKVSITRLVLVSCLEVKTCLGDVCCQ